MVVSTEVDDKADMVFKPDLPPSAASLRIIHVTDVYTLGNFPSLKTLVSKQQEYSTSRGHSLISVLTGDFLAPYLLSALDKGRGMMSVLNKTPIDYLTWGNHDGNDMPHKAVMDREREYKGVWINSNMTTHESFATSKCQTDKDIILLKSADGSNTRKIGMCAVLSNDPGLYKKSAFNGAKIDDPWETLKVYKAKLENEDGVDLTVPLCHLYEFQDEKTCKEFDFPLILSGHDHHCVDRIIEGTRLLKPGQDARCAIIVDITWPSADSISPEIEAKTVSVTDFVADELMSAEVKKAYRSLDNLKGTQLATIPASLRPATSFGSRDRHVTMGTFLCNSTRDAFQFLGRETHTDHCDCCIIKGANVRGGKDYGQDEEFSYESLLSETLEEHVMHVFKVPGHCIQVGLRETWHQAGPGWMQYSDDVVIDESGLVTHIAGAPLDLERFYCVASIKDLARASDGPTIGEYLTNNPSCIPHPEVGIPWQVLLLGYFADMVWQRIWTVLDTDKDGRISQEEFDRLDGDGDGLIHVSDLKRVLGDLHWKVTSSAEEDKFLEEVLRDAAGQELLCDDSEVESTHLHHAISLRSINQGRISRQSVSDRKSVV